MLLDPHTRRAGQAFPRLHIQGSQRKLRRLHTDIEKSEISTSKGTHSGPRSDTDRLARLYSRFRTPSHRISPHRTGRFSLPSSLNAVSMITAGAPKTVICPYSYIGLTTLLNCAIVRRKDDLAVKESDSLAGRMLGKSRPFDISPIDCSPVQRHDCNLGQHPALHGSK